MAYLTLNQIFKAALTDDAFALSVMEALQSDLVIPNPFQRALGEFIGRFYDAYQRLPRDGDIQVWLDDEPANIAAGVREALSQIQRTTISHYTLEYLAEHSISVLRQSAVNTAVNRLQGSAEVTSEILNEYAERVSAIQPVTLGELGNLKDVARWVTPERNDDVLIPTGIQRLDRALGGGMGRELTFIMADSGIGKTTALCNVGGHAALVGRKVLHITCELSTRNTIQRYYRRIAQMDRHELASDPAGVQRRMSPWLRMAKGEVMVMHQEAYTLTPKALALLCRRFVQQSGGLDLLVLDYLDLMAPDTEDNRLSEYQQLGRMTHKVRNLTKEFEISVLSATQSTREGGGGRRPRLQHMGDSYNKVRGADNIFALWQTDEEADANQARLTGLKVREAPGRGMEVPLYANMDLMMLADLDDPVARKVMEKYGHSPIRPQQEEED